MLALAGVVVAVAIAAVVTSVAIGSERGSESAKADRVPTPSAFAFPAIRATASPEQWWTPPPGRRETIEALAYAFPGIDEDDLGSVFTEDLKPIYDAPKLFEQRPPRTVRMDAMEKSVLRLRDVGQLNAGFNFLLADAGISYNAAHDYELYRALEVHDVVRLDETARMRKPSDTAFFYLAEVHRGASYDLLVEGDYADMGARLSAAFAEGGGAISGLRASGKYHLETHALGLKDVTSEGMFAMTPDDIAKNYRTGEPVPVRLVFRSIPGRTYRPQKFRVPVEIIDETSVVIGDGASRLYSMRAGKYRIAADSAPNGLGIEWVGGTATCDLSPRADGEYKHVDLTCNVPSGVNLRITNPSVLNMGPAEHVNIWVGRLP